MRQASCINCLEALEELLLFRLLFQDGLLGLAAELVVVALVADDGSKHRVLLQVPFPQLGNQGVQLLAASFDVGRRSNHLNSIEQAKYGCDKAHANLLLKLLRDTIYGRQTWNPKSLLRIRETQRLRSAAQLGRFSASLVSATGGI